MAVTWSLNVNLLSMITPRDLIAVETGRLTPATVTVVTLDAAFSCDDVPTSITSDMSAFNNKLANQCLTASDHISRVDSLL